MKKVMPKILPVLAILFLAVSGCSAEGDGLAEHVKEYYSGLSSMDLQASVTAEFSDYAFDFELKFSYDSQGESFIEVRKPVEIEGVRVKFDSNGTYLEYDGASLQVGDTEAMPVSPAAVMPELLRVWSEGIVVEQGAEKVDGADCIRLAFSSEKNDLKLLFRTWFERSSLKPLKADIFADGKKIIDCEFLLAENFK